MLLTTVQAGFSRCNRPRHRCFIAFLPVLFLLQSCGFELRGALDLSPDISPVYFQQNAAFDLGRDIKSILLTNKIEISEYANTANSRLIIVNEIRSRRVLSVDSNGRAKEYLLSYKVKFTIRIKQQEAVEDSVSVTRSLLFDPDAVLAVDNEAEVLYKDMRHDAARLITLKLQAYARNAAAVIPADDTAPAAK
jgi:LPS-assembly lipoprotein